MLFLRDKYQQQNNALASVTTWFCSGKSGHEWIASSSLHHTRTVKLALVQCEWHILVNEVVLQELDQLIGIKMLTSDFLKIFGS